MKIGGEIVTLDKRAQVCFGLISGVIYGLVHCLFRIISREPINPIQILIQLVFFAVLWYFIFFHLMRTKQQISFFNVAENQAVFFYGAAHHMIRTSTAVGVLYATDKQLVFNPEMKEFIANSWHVDWENIERIEIFKFIGLFDHGLLIQTKENRTFKFVVNQPQVWVQSIQNKIKSQQ